METKRLLTAIALLVVVAGCSGQYKGMPREAVLAYQTRATYGDLYNMAEAYAEAINEAIREDTLHPGMYADYGVALALMGHRGAACRMFNAEMVAFPESRGMVRRIKERLMPDLMEDTLAPFRDTANISQLLSWAYDSLTAMQPLPRLAAVIDSTDTVWLRRQTPIDSLPIAIRLSANEKRELLVKQQQEAEMVRRTHADSVSAAKQAKVEARKQAAADKAKAKKDKEKAKKLTDKEKKKQDKLKKKERERMAADKKKQQQQAAVEKERQRRQAAAEKERLRKQAVAEKERQRKQAAAEKKVQGKKNDEPKMEGDGE